MELTAGGMLGRYRLLGRAGAGGMAEVWRAMQPDLDRIVAVKVLPRHLASEPGFLERFRREARAISRLEHPNILGIYDFGEDDGYTYMVMPFLSGGTLARNMGQAWAVPAAVRVLEPIAAALDYAHANGIVHRDVKPSNVLIGEGGRVVLGDFGIARMTEGTLAVSAAGVLVGTPAYMAPEQVQGVPATAASDQYSLGVMAYEMLTGRRPFEAETPLAVALAHVHRPLPAPSSVNPGIPPPAELVLSRALAKRPEERYPTVSAFVSALAQAGHASTAPPRLDDDAALRPDRSGAAPLQATGGLASAHDLPLGSSSLRPVPEARSGAGLWPWLAAAAGIVVAWLVGSVLLGLPPFAAGGSARVTPTAVAVSRGPAGSAGGPPTVSVTATAGAPPIVTSAAPVAAVPATPTPVAASSAPAASPSVSSTAQTRTVARLGANIRSEPGSSGHVLRTLSEGALVEVLGPEREVDGQVWRQIRDSMGVTGWVLRAAIASDGPVSPRAPEVAGSPTAGAPQKPALPSGIAPAPKTKPAEILATATSTPAPPPTVTPVPKPAAIDTGRWQSYENRRFRFAIRYPETWPRSAESSNGDGANLYIGEPDAEITASGSLVLPGVSPYILAERPGYQRNLVTLDNGKEGTLVTGRDGDRVVYAMIVVQGDTAYTFYAKTTEPFYRQNQETLLRIAKSLRPS